MSKKFDEEYLTFLRDSTPDLWERIEINLDKNPKREVPKKKKRSASKKIVYFALPIAACIIIAISLPVWLGSTRMGFSLLENSANGCVDECVESYEEKIIEEPYVEECESDCIEECAVMETDEASSLTAPMENDMEFEIFESKIQVLSRQDADSIDSDLRFQGYTYVYLVKILSNTEGILEENVPVTLYVPEETAILDMKEYTISMKEELDGYALLEIYSEE